MKNTRFNAFFDLKSLRLGALASILTLASLLPAQVTIPYSVSIYSQQGVDTLAQLYPGFEYITGNLQIGFGPGSLYNSDIYDLSSLASLRKIGGALIIGFNPRLKSLEGLNNLDSIGVQGINFTKITQNDSLESLSGLENLRYVYDFLDISDNPRLRSFKALRRLRRADEITVERNKSLTELDGLDSLEYVRDRIVFIKNRLISLRLPMLRRACSFTVLNEPVLPSLSGLESLDSVGWWPGIPETNGALTIAYDSLLTDASALQNLRVGYRSSVAFSGNPLLKNLPPLLCNEKLSIINFEFNGALDTINMQGVKKAFSVDINDNKALRHINFPDLQTVTYTDTGHEHFSIERNDSLRTALFPELRTVYSGVNITGDTLLSTFDGFGKLDTVMGNLYIYRNSTKNLDGISTLRYVGKEFHFGKMGYLEHIANFQNKLTIGKNISFAMLNRLKTLDGLENLSAVGEHVGFSQMDSLQNADGITHIDSIGWSRPFPTSIGYAWIGMAELPAFRGTFDGSNIKFSTKFTNIFVSNVATDSILFPQITEAVNIHLRFNEHLSFLDFSGLKRLTWSHPFIYLRQNANLATLDGFRNLTFLNDSFSVRYNPLLNDCEAICLMLDRGIPTARFRLSGNAFPCNSITDIEANICDTLLATQPAPDRPELRLLHLYPNPAQGHIRIDWDGDLRQIFELSVYDAQGRKVLQQKQLRKNSEVSLHGLLPGVYAIRLAGWGAAAKLVVQE